MRSIMDQLGFTIDLPSTPQRIVSLVPSQTELLFELGLNEEIVGITQFCIHPKPSVKDKIKIGGTKNFRFEVIETLQPDLIIGNKEENYLEGIEKLRERYPVWMSDIVTLADALAMIRAVGQLVDRVQAAQELVDEIEALLMQLATQIPVSKRPPQVAYLIWRKPYMVAGSNTFIDAMLTCCGFQNVFCPLSRYPSVNEAQLQEARPDYIFLSSEPYPFREKHVAELQAICPLAQIKLVDGEMFSWYGSRLKYAVTYFQQLVKQIS